MANSGDPPLSSSSAPVTFADFPEDVQLCILSFLTPSEISSFACTSKRFLFLCRSDGMLWFSMCDRRWGSMTHIRKWGNGRIGFKLLYKTLSQWENLIGFWRRIGQASSISVSTPPLVFFEWGPSFVTGYRVSPSKTGTYQVVKTPFLWMGLSPSGQPLIFLDRECRFESSGDFVRAAQAGVPDADLIPVHVSFMGKGHFVLEENLGFVSEGSLPRKMGYWRSFTANACSTMCTTSMWGGSGGDDSGEIADDFNVTGLESTSPSPSQSPLSGSPPDDRLMSEIYQFFANRTSPGSGDRSSRRQRKRDKVRQGRRKLEPEHFVKIVNCTPTPSHPLQGLWKGFCDDLSLDFYLVAYDDIGGITCRKIEDASEPFSGYSPVFWTSNPTFVDSPFSAEEEELYDGRIHLRPPDAANEIHGYSTFMENDVVSSLLCINSSYDLVIPDLTGSSTNARHVEGRVWQYTNGTFGFGFLRNNFIVDLKHIALDGCLLDTTENCWD